MNNNSKTLLWVLLAVVVIGGLAWWYYSYSTPKTNVAPSGANPTTNGPQSNYGPGASADNSDAALASDSASIDAQMTALASDSSKIDSSLADQPIAQ